MTVQYTRNQHQTFLYWEYTGPNSTGGSKCESPVEIKGRYDFEDKAVSSEDGEESLNVSSIVVNQPIKKMGFLMEGVLEDLEDPDADPQDIDGTLYIRAYKETFSTNGNVRESIAQVNKK